MPKMMVSSGTSDTPETALLNAKAGIIGPMQDAAEAKIISQTLEHTPNGYVVVLQVALFDEDELEDARALEGQDNKDGEGDQTGVFHGRKAHNNIADYAYLLSADERDRDRENLNDLALEELVHFEGNMQNDLPINFEEAASGDDRPHDNDNLVYYAAQRESRETEPTVADAAEHITTQLSRQEIDDAVSHEMLSSDTVAWVEGEGAPPLDPALEFEEVVTPEGKSVKVAKKPPPHAESLDFVA